MGEIVSAGRYYYGGYCIDDVESMNNAEDSELRQFAAEAKSACEVSEVKLVLSLEIAENKKLEQEIESLKSQLEQSNLRNSYATQESDYLPYR